MSPSAVRMIPRLNSWAKWMISRLTPWARWTISWVSSWRWSAMRHAPLRLLCMRNRVSLAKRLLEGTVFMLLVYLWWYHKTSGTAAGQQTNKNLSLRKARDTRLSLSTVVHPPAGLSAAPQEKTVREKASISSSADQKVLDYMAENLLITFKILARKERQCKVLMTNRGKSDIPTGPWRIMLYYISAYVVPMHKILRNVQLELDHVEGFMFRLTPMANFAGFRPGRTVSFVLGTFSFRSEVFPNWYVAQPGQEARVLKSTVEESLSFDFSEVVSNSVLERRFHGYSAKELAPPVERRVVPSPLAVEYKSGEPLVLDKRKWSIAYSETLKKEASYLSKKLKLPLKKSQHKSVIDLRIGNISFGKHTPRVSEEAYSLSASRTPAGETVALVGAGSAGVFHGIQTLLSLVTSKGQVTNKLPLVQVADAPRFAYRGYMLDIARNFIRKAEILKLLDSMAMYKLNKFHLHLSDDQGWRLEIPGLPELIQVGARRTADMDEKAGLRPYLGAGPHPTAPGSGYLSVSDYQSILRHAKTLHIQVIPEVDLPGHSHAAISSMEARYRNYSAQGGGGGAKAREFRLRDPDDTSSYSSVNYFRQTTSNPCLESTYAFVTHVLDAIRAMHKPIQPLTGFHFGGDEVPTRALQQSPACQSFRKAHPEYNTTHELKRHFMERVATLLKNRGMNLQVWDDGIQGENSKPFNLAVFPTKEVITHLWKGGGSDRILELAKRGYKVILCDAGSLYFDHPQARDPQDYGLHWAALFIDTAKVFWFQPDQGTTGKPASVLNNIIGIQGHLWGETIRTDEHLETMSFPRLLALAERGWHRAAWELAEGPPKVLQMDADWTHFVNTLVQHELPRLDRMNIQYYLPLPGAVMEKDNLKVNSMFPGLPIEGSTDGGQSWTRLEASTKVGKGKMALATTSVNRKRRGRMTWINVR